VFAVCILHAGFFYGAVFIQRIVAALLKMFIFHFELKVELKTSVPIFSFIKLGA